MDSSALLDYALFQLTPTRTRCDLVVVCGGKSEKLASGLVETFISHLKFAKDQIKKGGYSIALRPPFPNAVWFTKPTFQRFVRFVSTPEILERFVQIEREILQIETSVESNEFSNSKMAGHDGEGCASAAHEIIKKSTNSSKSKCEVERADSAALEETSRSRLQRFLNTRKALLRKEQAMAYARAMVAGFEMNFLDNLICFADAFGAFRLREACLDFKELYKQKHTDDQWMEELAAMKAYSLQESTHMGTSGIVLAYENGATYQSKHINSLNNGIPTDSVVSNGTSDASSDITASPPNSDANRDDNLCTTAQSRSTPAEGQSQMPWPNQISPFVYHSQNQISQTLQGYPFPGVHHLQAFYPGHMLWPQTMDKSTNAIVQESKNYQYKKSSRKKEKSSYVGGPEASEDDEQSESDDSEPGASSDTIGKQDRKHFSRDKPHVKMHKKKSSKTVLIRNINYITSNRRNGGKHGSSGDSSVEALRENSIRREVDDAVESLEKKLPSEVVDSKNSSHQALIAQKGSNSYADQDLTHNVAAEICEVEGKNDNWSAFQNILQSHRESTSNGVIQLHPENFHNEHLVIKRSDNEMSLNIREVMNLEPQKHKMQSLAADDSVLLTHSSTGGQGTLDCADFAHGENVHASMKKMDYNEKPLISERLEESGRSTLATPSDFSSVVSGTRNRREEDWFIINHSGNVETKEAEQIVFDNDNTISSGGDSFLIEINKKPAAIDDSFMVQSQSEVNDQCGFQWRTDISTVADWSFAQHENGNANVAEPRLGISGTIEPDDLCMVLARDSGVEFTGTSWTPEIVDCGIDVSRTEVEKRPTAVETKCQSEVKLPVSGKSTNTRSWRNSSPSVKNSLKDTNSRLLPGSLAKSKKTNPTSRLMVQKSKLEMEEEVRKRMEELVIQRQKRIAERSASGGFTPATSKSFPGGSKLATSKLEKHRTHSKLHEMKICVPLNGELQILQ